MCIAFILAGLITIITGLSYAELSGRMPQNGSAYVFVYSVVGELPGFMAGWNSFLSYGMSGSLLSIALGKHLVDILG